MELGYFVGSWNIMILIREYVKQVLAKSDEAIDRLTETSIYPVVW